MMWYCFKIENQVGPTKEYIPLGTSIYSSYWKYMQRHWCTSCSYNHMMHYWSIWTFSAVWFVLIFQKHEIVIIAVCAFQINDNLLSANNITNIIILLSGKLLKYFYWLINPLLPDDAWRHTQWIYDDASGHHLLTTNRSCRYNDDFSSVM